METIIEFLRKNHIEFERCDEGIEYEGFYYRYFISNLQASSIPTNKMLLDIKSNIQA